MNVRLRMHQVLLFKFGPILSFGSIVECYFFIAFTTSGKHTLNASFSRLG